MRKPFFAALCAALALGTALPALAQSSSSADAPPPPVTPVDPARMGPGKPAADMQHVLDVLASLGGKPIETLTPREARMQPTPADAVKRVMAERGMAMDTTVTTREMAYGANPWQKVRVYMPPQMKMVRGGLSPAVVYYHGGGWVIADLDVYDGAPRAMAKALGVPVISVEYRHAPEAKFPAQHNDAAAAYRYVLSHAAGMKIDPRRMAMVGESAGGNLAVATALYARDNRLQMPRHIVSVYPIADSRMTIPSRTDSAAAKPLNTPMLTWFGHYYMARKADAMDPRLNLVAANLRGLPPVTIVNAAIDPLRSDGENLAAALRRAKVPVMQKTWAGVTHEFFGMGPVVAGSAQAQAWAVQRLTPALMAAGAAKR